LNYPVLKLNNFNCILKLFFLVLGKHHFWWCLGVSSRVFTESVWSYARLGSRVGVQSCLNVGHFLNCPCTTHTWV
jgi:hypothetical protein